jgi:hypothetical protein
MSSSATLTLLQARERYFDENGFGKDGGYSDRWVKLELGPIPFRIPNTASRVRAVRYHDLHHILMGYRTDWPGECAISAWEIGGGCADHGAAWGLNLSGMGMGLLFMPRAVARAFYRGRHTGNLYRARFDDALLGRTVEDMKQALHVDEPVPAPTAKDTAALVGWSVAALGTFLLSTALMLAPVATLAWGLVALLR